MQNIYSARGKRTFEELKKPRSRCKYARGEVVTTTAKKLKTVSWRTNTDYRLRLDSTELTRKNSRMRLHERTWTE